eukprot:CAMPEP_0177770462 /NCGR_PEP_ID=MMETSP0491_2-20121128/10941_1 /TAXON_ID=63592 /ORGANISM="Tetraselmis chuii, Strain PLY429" /LENGTH=166 /DNA_ID=CAMNT_0019287685 /DNA_START=9 /DNA_END=509 /DNA_ORIENTATION=+
MKKGYSFRRDAQCRRGGLAEKCCKIVIDEQRVRRGSSSLLSTAAALLRSLRAGRRPSEGVAFVAELAQQLLRLRLHVRLHSTQLVQLVTRGTDGAAELSVGTQGIVRAARHRPVFLFGQALPTLLFLSALLPIFVVVSGPAGRDGAVDGPPLTSPQPQHTGSGAGK